MKLFLLLRRNESTGQITHLSRICFTSPSRAAQEVQDYNRMDEASGVGGDKWELWDVTANSEDSRAKDSVHPRVAWLTGLAAVG
jgi:hypothetical protein